MKPMAYRWAALLLLGVLILSAAKPAPPPTIKKAFRFELGAAYGDRDQFAFTVAESGCILAHINTWSRIGSTGSPARELALILNGSDRTGYYARDDGPASSRTPLWVSYAVSPGEISQVKTWTLSVINFTRRGTAQGTVNLEIPPTRMPCELKATVSRAAGQIDLSWRYTGHYFQGFFLVERSTDGRRWQEVAPCTQAVSTYTSNYACTDPGRTSGTSYYYRACVITSEAQCGPTNLTPPVRVKAP